LLPLGQIGRQFANAIISTNVPEGLWQSAPSRRVKAGTGPSFPKHFGRLGAAVSYLILLGRAVFERWADLPRDIQKLLFEAAVS
jgi:hypothetical protein